MTKRLLCVPIYLLLMAVSPRLAGEGIPEPPVVYYGTIRNVGMFNFRMTAGALVWQVTRLTNGVPAGSFAVNSSLSNVLGQFSYVIQIPCESSLLSAPATNPAVLVLASTPNTYRFDAMVDGSPVAFTVPALSAFSASPPNRGRIVRADLTINAPCADINNNGICDWWEDLHFGDECDPNADPDRDGASNLAEFLAGTDPLVSSSVLVFVDYRPHTSGGFEVEWNSAEGRSYTLLSTTQLQSPNWTVIRSNIVSTPPRNTLVDTNPVPSGATAGRFYQLKLEL